MAKRPIRKTKPNRRGWIIFGSLTFAMLVATGYGLARQERPYSIANDNRPTASDYAKARLSKAQVAQRKQRILDIYKSLAVPSTYALLNQDVSGEKRLYEWDKYRTYASVRDYVTITNVDTTMTQLREHAINAGMTFYEEPYAGSVEPMFIYKTAQGEFVRIRVSSKPRDDAIRQAGGKDVYQLDPKVGPSNVEIKVNLDTNNE